MAVASFKKLELEIKRLQSLYRGTLYCFEQTSRQLSKTIRAGNVDPQNPLLLTLDEPNSQIARHSYEFFHKVRSQYPRYLRETIFVRFISSVEVYFVDVVREIFLARRDLFHTQNRIEFSVGEILSAQSLTDLWTRVINNELRKLQNQGFREVTRFYRNRLGIEFNDFSKAIDSIQEMHDRRHLLVHRLGKTDPEYRHRYNEARKRLTVDEEYLMTSTAVILEFAQFISDAAEVAISTKTHANNSDRFSSQVKLILEPLSDSAASVMSRSFHYSVDDRIVSLNDILVSRQSEGANEVLSLDGPTDNLRAYVSVIKRLQRSSEMIIHTIEGELPKVHNFPEQLTELVAQSLPASPWPKDIHKTIRSKFGMTSTQSRAIVRLIKNDERLLSMTGAKSELISSANDW